MINNFKDFTLQISEIFDIFNKDSRNPRGSFVPSHYFNIISLSSYGYSPSLVSLARIDKHTYNIRIRSKVVKNLMFNIISSIDFQATINKNYFEHYYFGPDSAKLFSDYNSMEESQFVLTHGRIFQDLDVDVITNILFCLKIELSQKLK